MLAGARERLAREPRLAERIELVEGQAEQLGFGDGEFDHLTFTYLLRYVDDPGATLAELARVVKPGGRIASLEFMLPPNHVARSLWGVYTRIGLPSLGRLLSRDWYEVGRFLGPCFLAVGISAQALDEFNGHPLKTRLSDRTLVGLAAVSLAGAIAIGIAGCFIVSATLIPFVLAGGFLVVAYNLELLGGRFHT